MGTRYTTSKSLPVIVETNSEPVSETSSLQDHQQDQDSTVTHEGETINITSHDWKRDKLVRSQVITAFLCLILYALLNQSLGPMIEPIRKYYDVEDSVASLVFLACTVGYTSVALNNEKLHQRFGLYGVLSIGLCTISGGCLLVSLAPPFWLFLACLTLCGSGLGCIDSSIYSWAGKLEYSNQLMGLLHCCFGIGSIMAPPLATSLVSSGIRWSYYYLILSVIAMVALIIVRFNFEHENRAKYRYRIYISENGGFSVPVSITEVAKSGKIISITLAVYAYMGSEASLGAWMISYLVRVKHGDPLWSSYILSSFWVGMTIGRAISGFITPFFTSEIKANQVYGFVTFLLMLLFGALSDPILSAGTLLLVGISTGPIFPVTLVAAIKLLPTRLHTGGLGFACSVGGTAAACGPYFMGLVASSQLGLSVFPIICASCFFVLGTVWVVIGTIYTLHRLE